MSLSEDCGYRKRGGSRSRGRGFPRKRATRHSWVGYRYIHSALDDCPFRDPLRRESPRYNRLLDKSQHLVRINWDPMPMCHRRQRRLPQARSCTGPAKPPVFRSRRQKSADASQRRRRTVPQHPPRGTGMIQPWTSETQRHHTYNGFVHFHNHHRSDGSPKWQPPSAPSRATSPKSTPSRIQSGPRHHAASRARYSSM